MTNSLPRILVIDDLFGRSVPDGGNRERSSLCGQFLLSDVSEDATESDRRRVRTPVAEAVFCRGQRPAAAFVGSTVENDLRLVADTVAPGWHEGVHPQWALVLLDLCFYTGPVTAASDRAARGMPEGRAGDDRPATYFGLAVLDMLSDRFPDLPVVIFSSMDRQDVSLEFARRGALGFLARSESGAPERLQQFLFYHGMVEDPQGQALGRSRSFLRSLRSARRFSSQHRNILMRGERGSGKELLARFLHGQTAGGSRPFVVVNSGALTPELYASELFGHRRGAFTGAHEDRLGRLTAADGGDLFLDEVGNMPLPVQSGLLRAIEHRGVAPIGSSADSSPQVRFLSATNADLDSATATGLFRADLLDRLREGGTIVMPPLRDRPSDIPLLAEAFVRQAERATHGARPRSIEAPTMAFLKEHPWPGNVRELRSCIFAAVATYPDVEHLLPTHLRVAGIYETFAPSSNGGVGPLPLADTNGLPPSPADLMGALSRLDTRAALEGAQMLREALVVTRRATVDHPEGRVSLQAAMRLLTGNRALTAAQAADAVKRIAGKSDRHSVWSSDPLLGEALRTALKLRPSSVRTAAAKRAFKVK